MTSSQMPSYKLAYFLLQSTFIFYKIIVYLISMIHTTMRRPKDASRSIVRKTFKLLIHHMISNQRVVAFNLGCHWENSSKNQSKHRVIWLVLQNCSIFADSALPNVGLTAVKLILKTRSEFLLQQTCAFCAESEGYASGTTSNLILPLEYIILAILVMIMAIFCDSEDSDDDGSQRSSFVLSKNVKQEINKYLSNISSHQNRSKVFGINLFLKTIV